MDEKKPEEMKEIIRKLYDTGNYKDNLSGLANEVMLGYIFGPYGKNEHYNIDEIYSLVLEVAAEKQPKTIVEE